jgi:excisionase family DNA binding protein
MIKIRQQLEDIKQLLAFNKAVWTLQDFCNYANISLDYGYHLTSTGRIKFYRPFGKKIYIDREDAISALKANSVDDQVAIGTLVKMNLLNQK